MHSTIVIKKFRAVRHGEHVRESQALRLLHRHAPGLAPRPLRTELQGEQPTVTMSRLPGQALTAVPPSTEEVCLIAETLRRLHVAVPADAVQELPYAISHASVEIPKLRNWAALDPSGEVRAEIIRSPELDRALTTARKWLAGTEPRRLMDRPGQICFGQSDPNIRNFIRDRDRLRVVDFEDSGRSDRETELADLLEHRTLRGVPEEVWHPAIDMVCSSPGSAERLLMARRMKAAYWLFRSLVKDNPEAPGSATERQVRAARVLSLML